MQFKKQKKNTERQLSLSVDLRSTSRIPSDDRIEYQKIHKHWLPLPSSPTIVRLCFPINKLIQYSIFSQCITNIEFKTVYLLNCIYKVNKENKQTTNYPCIDVKFMLKYSAESFILSASDALVRLFFSLQKTILQ